MVFGLINGGLEVSCFVNAFASLALTLQDLTFTVLVHLKAEFKNTDVFIVKICF